MKDERKTKHKCNVTMLKTKNTPKQRQTLPLGAFLLLTSQLLLTTITRPLSTLPLGAYNIGKIVAPLD